MKGLYNIFKGLNLLLILVTFLTYLSPFINPESFTWINILGTAYPWFLLANILFVIFWLFLKKRYFLFSFCCILMGWNHLTGFIGLSFSGGSTSAQSINVMTYNASGFLFLEKKDLNQQQQEVRNFKKIFNQKGDIDVLCLQEVSGRVAQQVIAQLKDFPHQLNIPYKGTAILSKYPIVQSGEVKFDTNVNSCVWADIKTKTKTVRFYSLHLKSNRLSVEAEKILKEGDIQQKKTWSDIKGVFGKFRFTSRIRVEQAKKVKLHTQQSPHPVIICGDFNETPQSYVYKMLSENKLDAFREKGFGLGTTYAGSIPALRIDFILADLNMTILDCSIIKEEHSDHYPVFSTLEIK